MNTQMKTLMYQRIFSPSICRILFTTFLSALCLIALSTQAATITVTNTNDDGGGSLRNLPPATIAVYRTSTGGNQEIDESVYSGPADTGSHFRIDSCQYVYNLSASALGVGTYRVDIIINGQVVGSATFRLR